MGIYFIDPTRNRRYYSNCKSPQNVIRYDQISSWTYTYVHNSSSCKQSYGSVIIQIN